MRLSRTLVACSLLVGLWGCGSSDLGPFGGSSASSSGDTGTTTTSGAGSGGSGGASGGTGSASGGTGGAGGASSAASGAGGAPGTSSTGAGGIPAPTSISVCQNHVYECGDLLDNDGDGLIDSQDPDCLGPCDNTEGGLYGGIPGQPGPACTVDCYFDQDSGSGNDDCHWSHKCDPHEVPPGYDPEPNAGAQCAYDPDANTPGTGSSCEELSQEQSQVCHDYCGPLTPNGCDCFGCCELPSGSGKYVWLGSEDQAGNGSCTLESVNDPAKCYPCMPVPACLNDCGHCELCIGKDSLPPDCFPGGEGGASGSSGSSGAGGSNGSSGAGGSSGSSGAGGGGTILQQCPNGIQPCGLPGQMPCGVDYYCITGCCQKVPT